MTMDDVKTLLDGEIKERLKELSEVDSNAEEYKTAVDGVTKLMDRKIEMDKLEIERIDKIDNKELEYDLKMRQIKEDKTNRWTRDVTNWVNLGIGAGMFIWGTIASINFEREGTFTTTAGRNNVKRVLSWFK
jgi:hypothetical protein